MDPEIAKIVRFLDPEIVEMVDRSLMHSDESFDGAWKENMKSDFSLYNIATYESVKSQGGSCQQWGHHRRCHNGWDYEEGFNEPLSRVLQAFHCMER